MTIAVLIFTTTIAQSQVKKCDVNVYATSGDMVVFDNASKVWLLKGKQAEGYICSYSKNGDFVSEGSYAKGKREGIYRIYNQNGHVLMETPYKNGMLRELVSSIQAQENYLQECLIRTTRERV